MRGKRNEPSFIPYIVQKIADIRGESEEKMREQIAQNVHRAFPNIK
jgi:TatD DNase family protein